MQSKGLADTTQSEFSYTRRATEQVPLTRPKTARYRDQSPIGQAKKNLQRLKSSTSNPTEKETIQTQIAKLSSLKEITIPMEDGTSATYYSIADNAGGVTAKTCLISEERLKTTLDALKAATSIEGIEANKIRMNAILKHPKAGKDTEVQREAIGLKMARLLGFPQVTASTLVSHDTGSGHHPCLFVPFAEEGKMDLLTESIANPKTMHGLLEDDKREGVEDFGKYSAYFMLCGDPDFIGKNGQNKGLAQEDGVKRLYIFDQVFMEDNNFGLDSAFNIVPTQTASKMPNFIARHFMGRNKSVVNDSSYEEKVKGAIHLLEKKDEIREMFTSIAEANASERADPIATKLRKDAKTCLKSFDARVASIKALFPPITIDGTPTPIDDVLKDPERSKAVNKAMVLNQLVNKPQSHDASGTAYRVPFLSNPSTQVNRISFDGEQVKVNFGRRFGTPLSEKKTAILVENGFEVSPDGKSATISSEKLLQLNEPGFTVAANGQSATLPSNVRVALTAPGSAMSVPKKSAVRPSEGHSKALKTPQKLRFFLNTSHS